MMACLALAWTVPASAQQSGLDQQARAKLAAIPLTTGDLPDGYRFTGEGFVPANGSGIPNVDPDALVAAGFTGMYVSGYRNTATGGTITSYVSAWTDASAANQGFALLEDEAVTDPDADLSDTALDAGTGSAELTTGTAQTDGATVSVSDATFIVDRYVVGVTVETPPDAALDEAGMQVLVDALEARASAVVEGQSPDGTDLALPPTVLDVRPLGPEIQTGYLSALESELLYGVSGSALGGMKTTWITGVGTGEDGAAPFVAIAVSTFDRPDNAARVVEQSADLLPVAIKMQPVDFAVDGADSAKGYQYASPGSPDGAVDSFRGVIQIGSTMVVVDVQAAASPETAQAAASELLAAQVACSGGTCELPELDLGS
jgi:hypothetical protein